MGCHYGLFEELWGKVVVADAKVQRAICRGANDEGLRRIIVADGGEFVVAWIFARRIFARILEQNSKDV